MTGYSAANDDSSLTNGIYTFNYLVRPRRIKSLLDDTLMILSMSLRHLRKEY